MFVFGKLSMQTVLFICSGNYYRSRFAEIYFNDQAAKHDLAWRAESRGFRLHPANVGPMSHYVVRELNRLGLATPEPWRSPIVLEEDDLRRAERVIAVKEVEHRPMMNERFPAWADLIEYWHIDDLDCAVSENALPLLQHRIDGLLRSFAAERGSDA